MYLFTLYSNFFWSSTHTQRLELRPKSTNGINVPHHKLPIHTARAHTSHSTGRTVVRTNVRDRVLVHREQFRVRRELRPSTRATAQTSRVRITERVERGAVETADGGRPGQSATRTADGRLGRRGVVERTGGLPAGWTAAEKHGLAIVARSDDGILRRPCERDVRERVGTNRIDSRSARIHDTDGAVVAYYYDLSAKMNRGAGKVALLAKARTSPEGEKPTECTQPPDGLEYSPHTVLNGSFSPHTEGGGLVKTA